MDILLIPCCKRKVIGGDQNYQPSRLADILHPATYHCLMEARLDLAKQLGLRQGPDLGFQGKSENSENYRKALAPWPTLKITRYHPYNYPGL